jgi:UDP-N-acetylenolpyruvoylglucosamine reductase
LLPIIQQHNEDIKKLVGKDYSKATWVKYNTTQKHITEFLKWKYRRSDINIKELCFEFITDFEFYLKSEKNIDVNTNAKYIKNLKKIIKECVCKDWL